MRNEENNEMNQYEPKVHIDNLMHSFNLAQAGRLAEAVEEVRYQIETHSNAFYHNFWLGTLLFDLGEYAGACNAFKKELEITPKFREAAWELGSANAHLGQNEEAIEAYERALDIDPCCTQALFGLGNAYRRKGDHLRAIEYYEDAIFILPELDQSDPRTGHDYIQSFTANIYINLGVTWMLLGNPEKAQEAFMNCQNIVPSGRLFNQAKDYLKKISDVGDQLGSIQWNIIEMPPNRV